jgi:hypothetical protein
MPKLLPKLLMAAKAYASIGGAGEDMRSNSASQALNGYLDWDTLEAGALLVCIGRHRTRSGAPGCWKQPEAPRFNGSISPEPAPLGKEEEYPVMITNVVPPHAVASLEGHRHARAPRSFAAKLRGCTLPELLVLTAAVALTTAHRLDDAPLAAIADGLSEEVDRRTAEQEHAL